MKYAPILAALAHFWPLVFLQFGFDGGGDGFGSIISEILDAALAQVLAALVYIWNALIALANYLIQILNFVWGFITTLFKDIANAFKWLWNNIVKVALTKAVATYLKIRQWLSLHLAGVLAIIKQIRAWYDWFFNQFVKPLLVMLQRIRQFLGIFRLLGFKWAARLDADIALIQNKIVSVFVTLRQYLNLVTSWVQLIVDPLGILRRNPLFASLIRSAPELKNLVDQATVHTQTQGELDKTNALNRVFLPSSAQANQAYYSQKQLPPPMADARQQGIDALAALPGNAGQQLG